MIADPDTEMIQFPVKMTTSNDKTVKSRERSTAADEWKRPDETGRFEAHVPLVSDGRRCRLHPDACCGHEQVGASGSIFRSGKQKKMGKNELRVEDYTTREGFNGRLSQCHRCSADHMARTFTDRRWLPPK